jgi:hypothetical protein
LDKHGDMDFCAAVKAITGEDKTDNKKYIADVKQVMLLSLCNGIHQF